ncbi:MAG TPA: FeoB small GTPase domain-containing protein, partial [Candidatus Polarisedimenticolaceae bacterium]|nr:FeoB small GTPase domain-containing protein [Candidatus Polarisedimenticolaceae bacterium]
MSEAVLSPPEAQPAAGPASVILVGNPNVGKSALFGALTGKYVTVSNYPGTTVEMTRGHLERAARVAVIDTPGTNSLSPSSDDERVTRDVVLGTRDASIVVVGDAKNLERTILLALQIGEMELPHVVALNMWDELASRGLTIDAPALARELGAAVVPTVAIRREGIEDLRREIGTPRRGGPSIAYPPAIERAVAAIAPRLPSGDAAARARALMVLGGETSLLAALAEQVGPEAFHAIDAARRAAQAELDEPLAAAINRVRMREAWTIADRVRRRAAVPEGGRRLVRAAERLTTHRVWGVPILLGVLWIAYRFVGVFGAGTLVDLLENGVFNGYINPAATRL